MTAEPQLYVVYAYHYSGGLEKKHQHFDGEYRHFIWAYTAEDAKTQVSLVSSATASRSIRSIEPYREAVYGSWDEYIRRIGGSTNSLRSGHLYEEVR